MIKVKLNERDYKLVDASDKSHIDIYIAGLTPLMQIDQRDLDIDYIGSILNDLKAGRISVDEYNFAGKKLYDVKVGDGSEWTNGYPVPASFWHIIKPVASKRKLGILSIAEQT